MTRTLCILSLVLLCGCGSLTWISPHACRSWQLDGRGLVDAHDQGVRTVLCLRGTHPNEPWWIVERAVCDYLGMKHISVALAASRMPTRAELLELLAAFDAAETPVLIHCKGGADRSGLACTLWLMVMEGQPKRIARRQLSLTFGHLWWYGGVGALDDFVEMLPDEGGQVRRWIQNEYYP